jgi:hypothetical protein
VCALNGTGNGARGGGVGCDSVRRAVCVVAWRRVRAHCHVSGLLHAAGVCRRVALARWHVWTRWDLARVFWRVGCFTSAHRAHCRVGRWAHGALWRVVACAGTLVVGNVVGENVDEFYFHVNYGTDLHYEICHRSRVPWDRTLLGGRNKVCYCTPRVMSDIVDLYTFK